MCIFSSKSVYLLLFSFVSIKSINYLASPPFLCMIKSLGILKVLNYQKKDCLTLSCHFATLYINKKRSLELCFYNVTFYAIILFLFTEAYGETKPNFSQRTIIGHGNQCHCSFRKNISSYVVIQQYPLSYSKYLNIKYPNFTRIFQLESILVLCQKK